MKVTTFGLDLAKRLFQVHWVDVVTGEICGRQLKRDEVLEFFARREPSVVAMEACGSAHYWGRKLAGYGHEVRLIAAQFYVSRAGIWKCAGMKSDNGSLVVMIADGFPGVKP